MPDDFDWDAAENQFEAPDTEIDDVINVKTLDNNDLLNLFLRCNRKLGELREEMVPRTDEGRRIHSLRSAARIELALRDLL